MGQIDRRLRAQLGCTGGTLHRSIAPISRYRFVGVGRCESTDPDVTAAQLPAVTASRFPAHTGLYEVVSCTERLTSSRSDVVLINFFEVGPVDDRQFIGGWERANEYLRRRPGYLSTRLHRSVRPGVAFRFVNIARWSSPESFLSAIGDPGFRAAADLSYPAHPGIYTVTASPAISF